MPSLPEMMPSLSKLFFFATHSSPHAFFLSRVPHAIKAQAGIRGAVAYPAQRGSTIALPGKWKLKLVPFGNWFSIWLAGSLGLTGFGPSN